MFVWSLFSHCDVDIKNYTKDFKLWVYIKSEARPVTLTLHATRVSPGAAETALATPVFSPQELSRSLRLTG